MTTTPVAAVRQELETCVASIATQLESELDNVTQSVLEAAQTHTQQQVDGLLDYERQTAGTE